MARSSDSLPVPIIEAYNGCRPPAYVRGAVEKLLRTVPTKYLAGLASVVLTNRSGQPRREFRRRFGHGRRTIRGSRVAAFYTPASKRQRPHIVIYVDKILNGPKWFAIFPPLRESWIGLTLFHELGHHVHHTLRPEYREEETVADEWRQKFLTNFFRKRYWYLVPLVVPVAKLVRAIKYGSE